MKKDSQLARAINLLKTEPNISAQDMAKKLGTTVTRTYAVKSNAKKLLAKGGSKLTPKLRMQSTTDEYVLKEENKKLTDWTLLWKQKYDKLEQDYTQAKIMYLDSQAVVKYLEGRIEKLTGGE
jgi:hypothetical protein